MRRLCDYHVGVGSDGILEVLGVEGARAEIVIWNPDGSTAELSGNGTRIAARWLARLSGVGEVVIASAHARWSPGCATGSMVETEMGKVEVGPVETLAVNGSEVEFTPVSVGNPHAVIRLEPDRADLLRLGPLVENHERFPARTNVQLVRVDSPSETTVGVWERGAGETLSSGTSAVAVAGAASRTAGHEPRDRAPGRRGHARRARRRLQRPPDGIGAGDLHRRGLTGAAGGGRALRFAARLDQVPPYLFAEIERRIEAMRADGVDVISLGIGDPDLPTPAPVIEALQRAAERPATHQYPSNRGLGAFREAVAGFYAARFGVDVDPEAEIIPVLGGKEAVAHVALACLDPGDVALSPDPGYPPYTSGPVFSGAEVHYLALREENAFMPDLDAIAPETASRANLLYFNYPNNPTGAVVTDGFFERAVSFAGEHDLVAIHDSAYTEIAFDGYRPPSFLATPGAKDVGAGDLLALEGLEHDRLARGVDRRQRRGGRALSPAEDEPRFGHVRRAPTGGCGRAHRRARLPARDVRDLPAPARPDDRRPRGDRDRGRPTARDSVSLDQGARGT